LQASVICLTYVKTTEDVDTLLDFLNTSITDPPVNPLTHESILIPTGLLHLGMYVATNSELYNHTMTNIY